MAQDAYLADPSQSGKPEGFELYLMFISAQELPYSVPDTSRTMQTSKHDEYRHIMNLMAKSSVIPARANLRYHIVSIEWFRRWQKYTSSQDENAYRTEPGPINTNEIDQLAAKHDEYIVWDRF